MFDDEEPQDSIRLTDKHEVCLSIDLGYYAELFCKKNTTTQALSAAEQRAFKSEQTRLRDYVSYFNTGLLYETMLNTALSNYSPKEQQKIRQSPAVSLMHDSFSELLKNAIDSSLKNPIC